MQTALDALAASDFAALRGGRVAVLSNPTGLLADLTHGVDAMVAAGIDVVGVLGPEHGFRGTAQAGFAEADAIDERTGVRVLDTYEATEHSMAEQLAEIDAELVVVDLQDVGVRFYTYIWSMYRLMHAVMLRPGTSMLVLDRPNPLGRARRGGMLASGFESGIGWRSILMQHGLTLGELAQVFNTHHLPAEFHGTSIDLQVLPVEGWNERPHTRASELPWVAPSPNLPTADAALLYPGTGLFEAVNLSEGRGTTRPFTLVGAPWVDHRWIEAVAASGHAGVALREASFTPLSVPGYERHAGQLCRGIELYVTDAETLDAPRLGVDLLVQAHRLYREFSHRDDDWRWLGLMTGDDRVRDLLLQGGSCDDLDALWRPDHVEWNELVSAALPSPPVVPLGSDRMEP